MTATFAPDTNFFLQCKLPDQIDWSLVTNDKSVLLVVVKEVRRELDRHKNGGNERRARRARRISSVLKELTTSRLTQLPMTGQNAQVQVSIARSKVLDPQRSKPAGLDLSFADERIVEEVLATSESEFGGELILLTHDSVPLECALEVGLEAKIIPDDWLLDPEPNEQLDELRGLKKRVELLEGHSPQVRVKNSGEADRINATVHYYSPLSADFISEVLARVERHHPRILQRDSKDKLALNEREFQGFLAAVHSALMPTPAQWAEYDAAYNAWLVAVKDRLSRAHLLLNAVQPGVENHWEISNTGSCSAERLIVDLEAKGPIYFDAKALKRDKIKLTLDTPPEEPRPALNELFGGRSLGLPQGFPSANFRPYQEPAFHAVNRHEFDWNYSPERRAKQCRGQCEEFRHGLHDAKVKLVIRPEIMDGSVATGAISVLVSASNLPSSSRQTIPIRIEQISADTIAEVKAWLQRDLGVVI